jgi:2-polyprenyl-3-methyl-5-hydroxy-6-metoxy-1,4-benzoquinol methylase
MARWVPFAAVNLNQPFAAGIKGCFDGVVLIEIAEHVENPGHLFREVVKLLRPRGKLSSLPRLILRIRCNWRCS